MDVEIIDALAPKHPNSKPTRDRRRAKRKKKGGKPGNQGTFRGARAAFLSEHLPRFVGLKGSARKAQELFWRDLFGAYWKKWPWQIPMDKEPEDGDWPEPDTELPDILAEKGKVIEQTQKQIQTHMRYQRSVLMREGHNPWAPLLSELEQSAEPSAGHRQINAWQFYMGKKRDEINTVFEEQWPSAGLPPASKLTFRTAIARKLFAEETDEFKAALQAELQDLHAAEERAAEEVPCVVPEADREAAQDKLAAVVQPLLELLREQTGYYMTLFAGIPNVAGEQEFKMKIITAGKTEGQNPVPWHALEPDRFKSDVVMSFTRFLMKTPGTCNTPLILTSLTELTEWTQRVAASSRDPSHAPDGAASTTLPAERVRSPQKSSSNAKGKGRQGKGSRAIVASDEDEAEETTDASSESSDEHRSDGESSDEDEDDADEDGGAPASNELGLDIPADAVVPTAEELGLGTALQDALAALPEAERRAHLYRISRMSPYDLSTLNNRAQVAEIMNKFSPTPVSLYLSSTPSNPRKKARRERAKVDTQGEPRRSERLTAKGVASASAVPSTSSTHAAPLAPPTLAVPTATTSRPPPVPSTSTPPTTTATASTPAVPSASTSPTMPTTTSTPAAVPSTSSTPAAVPSTSSTPAAVPSTSSTPAAAAVSSCPTTTSSSSAAVSPLPNALTVSLAPVLSTTPAPAPQPPSSSTSSRGEPPAISDVIMLDEEGWPQWLREAFDHLEGQRLGRSFMRALEWWTVLERAYEFKSSSKGLGAADRPPEVHHWLRVLRRVLDKPPTIENEEAYRTRGDGDRLVIGGQGSWEDLTQPGKNGMLIILLSLSWWRGSATAATLDDWNAAVEDVSWVIQSMARAAIQRGDEDGQGG
ncbi:hypothetical protein FKP32DRAFT_1576114 [Trametes sanguinea]|nr:hypothetical protein FKP32DRAFT_1576114 [Trametes sanguinea]